MQNFICLSFRFSNVFFFFHGRGQAPNIFCMMLIHIWYSIYVLPLDLSQNIKSLFPYIQPVDKTFYISQENQSQHWLQFLKWEKLCPELSCELSHLMSSDAPKLIKFYITYNRLMYIQSDVERCVNKIFTTKISIIGSIKEGHASLKFLESKLIYADKS